MPAPAATVTALCKWETMVTNPAFCRWPRPAQGVTDLRKANQPAEVLAFARADFAPLAKGAETAGVRRTRPCRASRAG